MRRSLLFVVPFLFARPLAAQPAPDAPVTAHVTYLLDAARSGFASIRGGATYGPGTSFTTSVLASNHPMRFQGAEAPSEVRVNASWNVLHSTWLPVAGTRAAADSAWDRLAREIAAVIPAAWRQFRAPGNVRHIGWQECEQGRGREVALSTSLPFQQPALNLIVYRYDQPCGAPPAGGGGG